jgi:hypothetical protein
MSGERLNWDSRKELAEAQQRASEVLWKIAPVVPLLRVLQSELTGLRSSLHRMASGPAISLDEARAVEECRVALGDLIASLDLATQVLEEPASISPAGSDYFDPDFDGVLTRIERILGSERA